MGSGVIVAPREVVTNCHVVSKASKIFVADARVVRQETARVPAGEFETWRAEPSPTRSTKAAAERAFAARAGTYELSEFQRAK